jgi:hypothetical protein
MSWSSQVRSNGKCGWPTLIHSAAREAARSWGRPGSSSAGLAPGGTSTTVSTRAPARRATNQACGGTETNTSGRALCCAVSWQPANRQAPNRAATRAARGRGGGVFRMGRGACQWRPPLASGRWPPGDKGG